MVDSISKGKGKAREERVIPVPDEPSNPYLVRITSHGKMNSFVTFALQFFQKHDSVPLVFHTLPASSSKSAEQSNVGTSSRPDRDSNGLSPTSLLAPRLISVVEIVKREYLKAMAADKITGLYQYNEVGILEDLPDYAAARQSADPEEARAQMIAEKLSGKNHLKAKQTPYMKITLSRSQLPDIGSATAQEPLKRKLSKSAKSRAKKRAKKNAVEVGAGAEIDMEDGDGS
ncbi:hypothetical protein MIND_00968500 [Mycena indigotica]|uniref:Uncharacterized protein n=1 Tax=Mycena indigotica TaxID=2126181 RepID=A0A8H6SD54_9AGAR|nr:uncharacterized protein MIND_00968500 [Mycena indigotica]KAF7297351.1 hypothetical protein MIND_00968500 [Mycena indigotica]